MAAMQKLGVANLNAGNGLGLSKTEEDVPDQFPAGLRVLVVDDDMTCLKILDQMLRKCEYNVTVCPRATSALSILRERKSSFDLVISDVHMPDMDGFKLLELVGLEMDLPVIMMSADRRTEMVMKGIKHGACDYLIKPVRFEELKNIWQHVVRKKWNENKDHEQSGSLEDSDKHRRGTDEAEYTSSVNDANDSNWKSQKKKRDAKEEEDDGELENDDPSTSKKPRVVWSVELHQQFVNAVNQLGIDKAVPKRILELMNVPGLTRENVASHLQKFRLYLKRLSGVAQHQGALHSSMCGPVDSGTKVGPLSRLDIQSLAASGQIPPQTLAALHAELLGRPSTGMVLPGLEQPVILQPSLQGPKCIPVDHREVTFGKPLMKCPSSMSKHFQPAGITVEDMSPSGFGSWVPSHLSPVGNASIGGLNGPQNGNMLVQMLQQQQQQQQQPPPQPLPSLAEASHLPMNVQSSCLVSPSPPPAGFQIGNNPFSIGQNAAVLLRSQMSKGLQAGGGAATINQTHPGYGGPAMDHMLLPQSNALPVGVGQVVAEGDLKTAVMQSGYFHGSPVPPAAMSAAGSSPCDGWRGSALSMNPAGRLAGLVPSLGDAHGSARATAALGGAAESQGRNLGFVGKDTGIIPSRFAADDVEPPPPPALNHNRVGGSGDTGRAQEELHLGFMEAPKVANPGLPHFSPADVMSVLSK